MQLTLTEEETEYILQRRQDQRVTEAYNKGYNKGIERALYELTIFSKDVPKYNSNKEVYDHLQRTLSSCKL